MDHATTSSPPQRSLQKSYRQRFASKRLSVDTLPGYYSSSPPVNHPIWTPDPLSEQPPDYPDSADDADQEDEVHLPHSHRHPPPRPSSATPSVTYHCPRPRTRFASSKPKHTVYAVRGAASSDTYLDSLLERSVQALEMSNALLQSSVSSPLPQPFHHPNYSSDQILDRTLQRRAHALDHRIRRNRSFHESWMDDLRDIVLSVEDLFEDNARNPTDNGSGISMSLPSSSPSSVPPQRPYTSLDHRSVNLDGTHRLRYAAEDSSYRSPPPRAMTQYVSVESSNGEGSASSSLSQHDSIILPPTLGLRSSSHISSLPSPPLGHKRRAYSNDSALQPSQHSSDFLTPSASHNILSQLMTRSSSPHRSPQPSRSSFSDTSRSTPRGRRSSSLVRNPSSRDSSCSRRSASPLPTLEIRPMTPPLEESTPPSSASSILNAPQTLERLRRILQDSPARPNALEEQKKKKLLPPPLIAKAHSSPSEPQEATTTASISRLLTKAVHHSSIRAPAPKQSSLKPPASPVLSTGQVTPGSVPSSGGSTPRHKVQFAELPESYSSSNGSKTSKSKSKKGKKKDERLSWWQSIWMTDPSGVSGKRFDERAEDKMARSWGRPSFGGGPMDDWTI